MKILSLGIADKLIVGYKESSINYERFTINKSNNVEILNKYKKSKYRNYSHFSGVIGKFSPWTRFLLPKEEVKKISYNSLLEVIQNRYKE